VKRSDDRSLNAPPAAARGIGRRKASRSNVRQAGHFSIQEDEMERFDLEISRCESLPILHCQRILNKCLEIQVYRTAT